MLKIQASWGVTVSTGTFTGVSKYGSSSIFRVNESNKALTSSETSANIWQSTGHNITEDYVVSARKTITSSLQKGGETWEASVRDSNKVLPHKKRGDMTLPTLTVTNDNKKKKR